VRRKTLRWAALALALAGLTCRDDHPIGPGAAGRAVFDVRAFALFAPGDPPVPVESLEVVFRRSDESIASADTVDLAAAAQGDSFVVSLDVPLDETPQASSPGAFGGGIDWVRRRQGAPPGANAPWPPGAYVGPGRATAFCWCQPLARGRAAAPCATCTTRGAARWASWGSSERRGGEVGPVNSATMTGAPLIRDSTWVYAETPTHLRDSVRVGVVPPPAQLVTVSGGGQSGPPGLALRPRSRSACSTPSAAAIRATQ
jgi:hypothetical protein